MSTKFEFTRRRALALVILLPVVLLISLGVGWLSLYLEGVLESPYNIIVIVALAVGLWIGSVRLGMYARKKADSGDK